MFSQIQEQSSDQSFSLWFVSLNVLVPMALSAGEIGKRIRASIHFLPVCANLYSAKAHILRLKLAVEFLKCRNNVQY